MTREELDHETFYYLSYLMHEADGDGDAAYQASDYKEMADKFEKVKDKYGCGRFERQDSNGIVIFSEAPYGQEAISFCAKNFLLNSWINVIKMGN